MANQRIDFPPCNDVSNCRDVKYFRESAGNPHGRVDFVLSWNENVPATERSRTLHVELLGYFFHRMRVATKPSEEEYFAFNGALKLKMIQNLVA